MTYKITFTQKPGYLHAVVTGSNTKKNVVCYLADIHRECIERACMRVLIEEHLEGPRLGAIDVFEIASKARDRVTGPLPIIAFVDVNAVDTMMAFAEDVAVNRGTYVRVFKTLTDAERWLLELNTSGIKAQLDVAD